MIPLAGADYSINLEFDKKRSFEMNLSLQIGHIMFESGSVIRIRWLLNEEGDWESVLVHLIV